jgi:hypothetical protein
MKRNLFLLVLNVLFLINTQAQIPPQAFNYSAVARDAQSNPIASQTIGIQLSVLQTTPIGTVVYAENHFVNTDQFGLFNLIIGAGAIQSGSMGSIDWSSDNYFLEVGMDTGGGTNFLTMGTTQLISVPYALHAATADSLIGGGSITETDPIYSASVASGITAVDTANWNADIDPDPTNELQTISISNDTIYLSNGGFAVLPANSSGGGKSHLMLSGDITDAQAALKIQNEVGPNTQIIRIKNTTNLTSVDLSSILELVEIQITDNVTLNTVNLPNLEGVYETLYITNSPLLISGLSFTNMLFWPPSTTIANTNISTLLFPNMINNTVSISGNGSLTTINFPDLSEANGIVIATNGALTTISLPVLTSSSGSIQISGNPLLSNVSMPNLSTLDSTAYFNILGNSSLTNIDLPNLTNIVSGGQNYFSSNQLSSTSVNLILDRFVNSITPITSGFIFLNNQVPPAPPTGQGLTDKTILQGQGVNVFTD